MENIYLKFPTIDDKQEYQDYIKEIDNIDNFNYEEWLKKLIFSSKQTETIDGRVPRTVYFLTDGKTIYAQISIRYTLDDPKLSKFGGHIGYNVRPKYRKMGYGTKMLQLCLEKCKDIGLKSIMISCIKDNIASAKIIEKNGGIFEKEIYDAEEDATFKIYWIKLF